jgi:hypothetical protein
MATRKKKDVTIESLSARDWDDAMPSTYQPISDDYLAAAAARSLRVGNKSHYGREGNKGEQITVLDTVEEHPFSMLAYGRKSQKIVIPACRATNEGNFIQIGPEVEKFFCDRGLEFAYVVWLRLQRSDLMHHLVNQDVWLTGVHAITLAELAKSFPKRSERWVAERIHEIEVTLGLYKESRRDVLTGEQQGFAYYPFMMYAPKERIYEHVPDYVENWTELQNYLWRGEVDLRENPEKISKKKSKKKSLETQVAATQDDEVSPHTVNGYAVDVLRDQQVESPRPTSWLNDPPAPF